LRILENTMQGKDTGIIVGGNSVYEKFYVKRGYKKVEKVTKIEKISLDGKVLATFKGFK